jgi:hypothetical protein
MSEMDENPYESPKVVSEKAPAHMPARRMTLAIVLGILTLPAAGIAFFTTCLVAVVATDGPGASPDDLFTAGLSTGSVFGLIVVAVMSYFTIRAARRRS